MEDTHTTLVIEKDKWVEIFTQHDQSGSVAIGLVPLENIPMLIDGLKKFISINPPVSLSVCRICKKEKVTGDSEICTDCWTDIHGM